MRKRLELKSNVRFVGLIVVCLTCAVSAQEAANEATGPARIHERPSAAKADDPTAYVELPSHVVQDKIRGGLLGQLLGNLNGLKYEFKFGDEPGNVTEYVPGLPDGARTDDDTDIEWLYVVEMQRSGRLLVPYPRIRELWLENMQSGVWVANLFARELMQLGIEPPLTGRPALNPKSDFNISGQFVCETFGLIAPAMPRTAARIGLHHTHVAIDGEPAQTTQLFATMIAVAFRTDDINELIDAGLAAVDPRSDIYQIVEQTRAWHRAHPNDWRATRRLVKDRYFPFKGAGNGYGVCTASVIAALLYGQGDFTETVRLAFNFGWDADNNAATAATILGVVKGRRWFDAQGWRITDRYRNTTRPGMPDDETITRFGDRLIELAELAIRENGGSVSDAKEPVYRIAVEKPANVEPLTDFHRQFEQLQSTLRPQVERDLAGNATDRARAAYLAICLELDTPLRKRDPQAWQKAAADLQRTLGEDRYKSLRTRIKMDDN
ncbi:MAG: ADP-ribosylglycohydrolase family protein [Planctomycetia bacterium]|nr:ADP-ribosylglycohydrolase family protein [Planctomycetia bacterium]